MRKRERRPRPGDFTSRGRYYSSLLSWLDWEYDDRVDRARKFHKIIEKENAMPVKREARAAVETPTQRAARLEMEEVIERAGEGPIALEAERARIVELIMLDRELEPEEEAELDKITRRRHRRERSSKKFTAAVDQRQRKHSGESRGESALAVALKQGAKRDRRDALSEERRDAAQLARQQEHSATADDHEPEVTPAGNAPPTAQAELPEPIDDAPHRRRIRAGIRWGSLDRFIQ